mmetsp:Transcript_19020/g.53354  ORF Transcript_19020/g.53354 Transcript_19020/m.53354 type:complete len:311 (-) Transcript_19020:294-1226(-)|eukprot:CAMPEP_0119151172 /NCGR_PEP_ID=MMETSP1310-20130426/45961_1 /TAXON_ID=464262 /ORGANISM="Genus nov. species nov., Strain RCC2339" /LENGTH=310 /DNA_ID=CAMNT_0007143427 /DNA_START=258 /DNA_END=1190 /DNA_ORIENTATION=-
MAGAAGNPIYNRLHEMKVDDIASQGSVLFLKDNSTVQEAVDFLAEHRIISAPVKTKDEVVGYVDMLDLVCFIVKVSPDKWCLDNDYLRSLQTAGRAISLELVSNVLNESGRDPYVPLCQGDPATEAVTMFSCGLHRVAVIDRNSGELLHTLAQSDLARVLAEELKRSACKHIGAKSLKELGLSQTSPLVIDEHCNVLGALQKIDETRVSALGVVEANGKLIGNFSASDLVGLYRKSLPDLTKPVDKYLAHYSPRSLTPIVLTDDATLLDVVNTLVESKIHRVWLVDADGKPTGVVSLTDIASFVKQYVYT